MARSRNIKPGFFTNDKLVELPFEVRLLFIGLWCIADKKGRLCDRPKKIKMELFPADDVDCNKAISFLEDSGFLLRYEISGEKYIQIVNWKKHQNPHIKETDSIIPENPGQAPEIPEQALLIPDSLNPLPLTLNPITTLSDKSDASPLMEKNKVYREDAKTLIAFLNSKTGKAYRMVDTNLKPIESILKSGVTLQEMKTTTMRKINDWQADPKMQAYLRPGTLYRRSNFENYLGQTIVPEDNENG